MLLVKHFSWRGHFSLFMQLQVLSLVLIGGSRSVSLFVDDRFYVWHKAIAYFYVVSIKNLGQLVMWWDMFVNQSQKCFTYFCHYRFTEWWVKTDNIPFWLSMLSVIGACIHKFQFMIVTRDRESALSLLVSLFNNHTY